MAVAAPPRTMDAEAPPDAGMPEPTWEVALLFPCRGDWTEDDYLALPDESRVELSDGHLEVLPMPTEAHQLIAAFLYRALFAFTDPSKLGTVLFAGLNVRLWPRTIRRPDVVFMRRENAERRTNDFWQGADLAMEVVSGGSEDRKRDLTTKRSHYARAGIAEYWVVDPREELILVLTLEGDTYRVHGEFARGAEATSVLLPGFSVSVDATFDAATEE